MAEITKDDLFSAEALAAPKQLAKDLDAVVLSINNIIAASKQSEAQLKGAASVSTITKEVDNLTIAEKELKKVNDQLAVTLAKNNDEYIEAKKTLDDANTSLREKIKADKSESDSINALVKQNKELKKQRDAISTATEEGRKKIAALNASLDQNNTKIKENSSALEKQKMNVGNYAAGFTDAFNAVKQGIPALGGFAKAQDGINLAMKANPVGAVVALFFALKEILGGNAVVADNLSFAFSAINKAFGFIIDTIVTTVSSFDNLKAAITSPIQFLKNLASGTLDAGNAGFQAAKDIDAFALAQAEANQAIQIADVQIKSLEKTLKDRTKTEKERIAIANQIADMEIANAQRREDLAKQELANEQLLLKGKTLSGDEEAKLKDLETKVFIEAEERKVAESMRTTRINILLDKEEKASAKDLADEKKKYIKEVTEAEDKALIERYKRQFDESEKIKEELLKSIQPKIDQFQLESDMMKEQTEEFMSYQDLMDKRRQESFDKNKELSEKQIALQISMANELADVLIGAAASNDKFYRQLGKNFLIFTLNQIEKHLLAVQAATIAEGTAKALASGLPIPLAVSRAIALTALIKAAFGIAKNQISKFEKGTDFAPGGLAYVGEAGRELIQMPSGKTLLSPDSATLMNLPKGSKVIPNEETMRMLAMNGLTNNLNTTQKESSLFYEIRDLKNTIRESDGKIVDAINSNSVDLVRQGSLIYSIRKTTDGNKKIIRSKSMGL